MDLSVVVPGRQEMFMRRTCEDILANSRGDTEVIAVADGWEPDPPLFEHPRLKIINNIEAIGQRAATNQGARASNARFIMKADAHCAFDEGFDVKLMRDFQDGDTVIPAMWNLHCFDWRCGRCGDRTYQGVMPKQCEKCDYTGEFEMVMVWKPRTNRETLVWRFDNNLQFQYWHKADRRAKRSKEKRIETMSFIGACMFLERERFFELGGMDEAHGSWGAFGTEWACKTWLSGGQLITNRNTWYGHMFRTSNFRPEGGSTWPYPISQSQIDHARAYSRDLWLNDRWPQAIHPLSWLVEKFKPVPDWHDGAE